MTLIGHGIDIVEVAGIAELLASSDSGFGAKCFTEGERHAAGEGPHQVERLTGRFAAKEAVLKALETGWTQGIAWTDVEVETLPSGAPAVRLHGRAATVAAERGITGWFLSISHTSEYATASAIAVG
jgi:holo-[acyl-carrier protein] synthase